MPNLPSPYRPGAFLRLWTRWWLLWSVFLMVAFVAFAAPSGCRPGTTTTSSPDERLPELGARGDDITLSGISSGAYMAGQFQFAHAEIVSGAAIIAGGPYGCAESAFTGLVPGAGGVALNATKAVSGCMLAAMSAWGVPNPDALARRAGELAAAGRIGPISAVASDRVYLFSGQADTIVRPQIVAATRRFYDIVGVPPERLTFVDRLAAGHAFITHDKGGRCDRSEAPYVVDCDYDQAGSLLSALLPGIERPGGPASGEAIQFDQTEFDRDAASDSLAATGVVYVPRRCRSQGGCRIHVAFHGCAQGRGAVGQAFIRDTGFWPWADANRLIVLFPEVAPGPGNPQGCWDWWGYSGPDFLTRQAPQIVAVKRMIDRLAAARTAAFVTRSNAEN
ncbi:MAG: poly(3-hydroxybutyrate) depolymerase [Hyphomicrobiaceae bacterium]|nr:poly(3-hydroxybutyrate) depolymerase [Hyphomicrobiaceae bacterium]